MITANAQNFDKGPRLPGPARADGPAQPFDTISHTLWDAVIIGAGPGGSVAACVLARNARKVLLVDRAPMPREKVCGCCLAPGGVRALTDLKLDHALTGAAEVSTCLLRAGRFSAPLHTPPYLVIDRGTLDHRLALSARSAGAQTVFACSARVCPNGTVELRPAQIADFHLDEPNAKRPPISVRARVVIVADGLAGTSLDDRPECAWSISPASRMGVGAVLDDSPVPLAPKHMVMVSHRCGYVGLVRLPCGKVDLAAALDPAAVRESGGPGPLCASVLESCSADTHALANARWRGTPLLTRRRACVQSGNVLVLGDAAGYVEPFTGEGMTWVIRSGHAAAELVLASPGGLPAPGTWAQAHARDAKRQRFRCALVSRFVRHDHIMALTIAAAHYWPMLGRAAVGALAPRSSSIPGVPA